jgi:hypothetical protein
MSSLYSIVQKKKNSFYDDGKNEGKTEIVIFFIRRGIPQYVGIDAMRCLRL